MFFMYMFSRKWILTTLLVIAAVGVLARLGAWQLERLAQRRAFNAQVQAQISRPALALSAKTLQGDPSLAASLAGMAYRQVTVSGEYDFLQQVALRNQANGNQLGVHLLTPLHIAGSDQSILVDRGWIPAEEFASGDWSQYDEPGAVVVQGVLRASQSRPDFGRRSDPLPIPGGPRLAAWNFANVDGIARQVPYPLLPAYIQQAPSPAWTGLPARSQPTLDLSEGPHQSYALQWFSFAVLLAVGYPFFIRRQESAHRTDEPPGGEVVFQTNHGG